ncbi:hypothetical protein [Brevibacillus brevis]|uniref:DUF4367 domain-containing protein n=1 Tax=Brevibacillus brevis TaxID=1393 RepID=A0ABY9T1B1_BREBE|nr:hypothetical protein [Brevibacillus brevis]WNC13884.1 hypothetical protein RGB73_24880 [Brevibacillus brevis]
MKYKVGILVAAGMVLTVSTAFAAVHYQTLKNNRGEVVYEKKTLEEANYTPPSKEEQLRSLKSEGYANELLKEGTAAIFYVASDIPDGKTYTKSKGISFTDVSALRKKMKDQSVKILDSLEGTYKFESASVTFAPITEVNPPSPEEKAAIGEKLRKQAEETKKEYAMMPVELSKDHWILNSTYIKQGKRIRVSMSRTSGKETFIVHKEWDFKEERLTVNGVEMIFTDFGTGKNIQWVYNVPNTNQTIRYHIEASNPISKEELMKMAEAYMN